MIGWLQKYGLYIAWVQALAALLGSLYFSEVVGIPPCTLCWYQRILMYPLVVIIAVGIIRKDKGLPFYVLPLSIPGMVIAFYQHLLQVGIIPEALAPCGIGVSCAEKTWSVFSFVTIPLLSTIGFAIITLLMVNYLRSKE
ncbi:MAG: putative disulfide formation protein [Candidatus Daviesbacteria bacterium GW2011_GWA2_42_7]|uniref:Putative disulfide formation protein n=2 Tax=Candidatus Daviesiibacteriota TaxID=1752718 RepID=A0A0G1ASN9_9BACT|nr:MAG: putative disulfide formation protein [Candidatus Daviesbacteria bacterium GW2011_GWA1_42_6]KKS70863.1 MAG: putative disulfide formation protein [Candidatus Daviesbacteria bacterium GW2011_GWA2_42_7]